MIKLTFYLELEIKFVGYLGTCLHQEKFYQTEGNPFKDASSSTIPGSKISFVLNLNKILKILI